MRNGLTDLTAAELAELYGTGQASPVDAINAVIERVHRADKALNAFCYLDADTARAAARESEGRWRRGEPKSMLDGVPVSVKDNICVRGMPTLFGSRAVIPENSYSDDSPAVARLREAGAVIFGKTCLPDFAHKIVTDSPLTGVTRNPHDLERTPGGSSGGAAAAIAARMGPLALGSDGGGSIRIPAAFTGIFGFKPSFGRVPHSPRGAFALLSHAGPMTRTVRDAALMMEIIARPDSRDWYALPFDRVRYSEQLRDQLKMICVATSNTLGLDINLDPEVRHAVEAAAGIFSELGACVDEDSPSAVPGCAEIHKILWQSFSARLARSLGERQELLDPSLQALAKAGEHVSNHGLLEALIARGELGAEITQFFDRYDLLICPVYQSVAPSLADTRSPEPLIPLLTSWCNQLGLPAASIFCGKSKSGMPIGLQVIGRPFADTLVLAACHAFEQLQGLMSFPTEATSATP